MARLEDIARVLGISKSTVSKALSGASDVSDAMRRSVVETAVEMGYSRLRRSEEAPKMAVFITNMAYTQPGDFGYDILVGFRKLAEPAGYQVCILDLTRELEESIGYDAYMMQHNYRSGLFLGLSLDHPWLEDFKTCRTPTVVYDNYVSGNPKVTYVGVDNLEAMRSSVGYLNSLGHSCIGYLGGPQVSFVYQRRRQAFAIALRETGLHWEEGLAFCDEVPFPMLETHLSNLLQRGCTAIICSHDALASQVLSLCHSRDIRVPEDVSIVGFDDLPLCQATQPPLTTIQQNRAGIGKSAFCALASQLEGVPLSTFLLHTQLVIRGSCAGPKQ